MEVVLPPMLCFAGTVTATLGLSILGCNKGGTDCDAATVGLVKAVAPTITQSDASKDSCMTSLFTGKRVAATIDCAALKAMKDSLFGQ